MLEMSLMMIWHLLLLFAAYVNCVCSISEVIFYNDVLGAGLASKLFFFYTNPTHASPESCDDIGVMLWCRIL